MKTLAGRQSLGFLLPATEAGFLLPAGSYERKERAMGDFSSVVLTTDAGSCCVHRDVDDDVQQSLRRVLITAVCFLQMYHAECGEVSMELCGIADDLDDQAAEFVRVVRTAFIKDISEVQK